MHAHTHTHTKHIFHSLKYPTKVTQLWRKKNSVPSHLHPRTVHKNSNISHPQHWKHSKHNHTQHQNEHCPNRKSKLTHRFQVDRAWGRCCPLDSSCPGDRCHSSHCLFRLGWVLLLPPGPSGLHSLVLWHWSDLQHRHTRISEDKMQVPKLWWWWWWLGGGGGASNGNIKNKGKIKEQTRELISAQKTSQRPIPEWPMVTLTWHASKYPPQWKHQQKCSVLEQRTAHVDFPWCSDAIWS